MKKNSNTCLLCKYNKKIHYNNNIEGNQCINKSSLLYGSDLLEIKESFKDFGCNQWEQKKC